MSWSCRVLNYEVIVRRVEREPSFMPRVQAAYMTIPDSVIRASQQEIRLNPQIEVGGKYVGHSTIDERGTLHITVLDYIDAGLSANRTATYHLPDADYQVRAFREAERTDPSVLHLGSWHSHHPNGLAKFSSGDINGYIDSVNSADHSQDFFLASLATDARGLEKADHFLFWRGTSRYHRVESIRIVKGPRAFAEEFARAADQQPWHQRTAGRELLKAIDSQAKSIDPDVTATQRGDSIIWRGVASPRQGNPVEFVVTGDGLEIASVEMSSEEFTTRSNLSAVELMDGDDAVRTTLSSLYASLERPRNPASSSAGSEVDGIDLTVPIDVSDSQASAEATETSGRPD